MHIFRAASLGSNFTGFYEKKSVILEQNYEQSLYALNVYHRQIFWNYTILRQIICVMI